MKDTKFSWTEMIRLNYDLMWFYRWSNNSSIKWTSWGREGKRGNAYYPRGRVNVPPFYLCIPFVRVLDYRFWWKEITNITQVFSHRSQTEKMANMWLLWRNCEWPYFERSSCVGRFVELMTDRFRRELLLVCCWVTAEWVIVEQQLKGTRVTVD